jgi:spore coat polysaccharide biosynthesis protein SpsF (cytidylyltransferase family)
MSVLEHVIRRARSFGIDPIVCTSTDKADDRIEATARAEGAKFFRGSLVNKLKRWSDCAAHFNIDMFHTVDADDPFFEGDEMRRSMERLEAEQLDVVAPTPWSSSGGGSVGYSLRSRTVEQAVVGLGEEADTEMMWYYVERVPGVRMATLQDLEPLPVVRLTLDYEEDYWLLQTVCRLAGNMARGQAVYDLFRRNPDLHRINWFRNEQWKAGQEAKNPQPTTTHP